MPLPDDVPRVRPLPVSPAFGFDGPDCAIDAAGGVPGGDATGRALVVVVNDPDRATRSADALRALRARAGRRRIEIVVATGSHKWDTPARTAHATPLLAAAGDPCRIHWHDGHDAAASVPLPGCGRLFSKYFQLVARGADVVVIGSVEPHWFAGVTGGHKALSIGLMPVAEIARNHRNAMSADARPFVTAGNPVYDDLRVVAAETSALAVSGRTFAVQHCADRWLAGDPFETLAPLAEAAKSRWLRRVPRPLDFVVAHVEPPLSRTLYQAEKAIKHGEFAVRDGGTMVLVAGCEDGVGPSRFVEMMAQAPDVASMVAAIDAQGYRLGDHKAVRLRRLLERGVRLVVVSEVFDPAKAAVAGFTVARTLDEAVSGLSGHGVVVEDGAHCVLGVAS